MKNHNQNMGNISKLHEELGNGCHAIIHRYPEPLVRLGNFPTSAEAEAIVEAVMPIYWAERGYE